MYYNLIILIFTKFKEKDELANIFHRWSSKENDSASMMWDWRLRKLHGDRYDSRSNIADWDYHMRVRKSLSKKEKEENDDMTSNGDVSNLVKLSNEQATIIHSTHFKKWRDTGIAYELRESSHEETNRTMITEARGRANEFQDRNGDSKGRRVHTIGFWGDIRNPPYIALGIRTNIQDEYLFKTTNHQHLHTSIDVMERLVDTWIHNIEHGAELPDVDSPPLLLSSDSILNFEDEDHMSNLASKTRITFLTGDIEKVIIQKKAYKECFHVISVGCWQSHTLKRDLGKVAHDCCILCAERGYYMTEFKEEQIHLFDAKMEELLSTVKEEDNGNVLTEFVRTNSNSWERNRQQDRELHSLFGPGHLFFKLKKN